MTISMFKPPISCYVFRSLRLKRVPFLASLVYLTSFSVIVFLLVAFFHAEKSAFEDRSSLQVTLIVSPALPENTDSAVKYTGTATCIDCHQKEHASYLQTTHSQTAHKTDVSREPAAGSFRHPHTGDLYESTERNGELIHREVRYNGNGKRSGETEAAIVFSIGSGAHGKSYIHRTDNFWAQSPMSWYKDNRQWGMSPGYERPLHQHFSRKIDDQCFFCHVGKIDRNDKNPMQFEIAEETIGCERCHGPGELHLKKHQTKVDLDGPDHTIVNPRRLERGLAEAICQQCHLQGIAEAIVSGADPWDYRPGLPLTDSRVDYQYQRADEPMKIVGHVEQMHESKCFKQSESLTCVTCHDPHHTPPPVGKIEFYRSVCLTCHEDQSCPKPIAEREQLAENDCSRCHMPAAPTNVVHAAFRNHRIGIHDRPDSAHQVVARRLYPILDITHLTKLEQKRCEALAKATLVRDFPDAPDYAKFGTEAAKALIEVKNQGKDDAEVNSALAWLAKSQGQTKIAETLARDSLAATKGSTNSIVQATRVLASLAFERQDMENAVPLYRQLTTLTRDANDTYFLGMCEQNAGDTPKAIAALKRSIEIDPTQEASHVALHAIYLSLGKATEANLHQRAAMENQQKTQLLIEKSEKLSKSK